MPDQYNGNHAAGQRAQQQLRDLGQAVRNAGRALDKSYPDAAAGDRILRQYEKHIAHTLQPPPVPQPQKKLKRPWIRLPRLPQLNLGSTPVNKYDLYMPQCHFDTFDTEDSCRKKRRN
jgi:hypothetical protein